MDRLVDTIALQIKAPGGEVVGLVVDANDSIDKRWNSIASKLNKIGIATPIKPDEAGTIIEANENFGNYIQK